MLGWANETSEILRNRSLMPTMETCFDKLREMADEDVSFLHLKSDNSNSNSILVY